MKKIIFGFCLVLLTALSMLSASCYAHVNGSAAGVEVVHDQRWHYDHDYNDEWRAHHPWHEDRHDWDH